MNSNQAKKRILFVCEAVTLAHFGRSLALAESLDSTKYDVHFAYSEYRKELFNQTAAKTLIAHTINSISAKEFLVNIAAGKPLFDQTTLAKYVQEELALIEEIMPDLIIGDLRLSLSVSAQLKNIPYANLVNSHWSPYSSFKYLIPDIPIVKLLGRNMAQKIFNIIWPLISAAHAYPLNRLRIKHGLKPLNYDIRHVYTDADFVLYPDIPSHTVLKNVPANHYFLGPILWEPVKELPDWWHKLPFNVPIIYLSLGTTGELSVLPLLIKALGELPVSVMLATAQRFHSEELPSNIYMSHYLPGKQCAARAQLVICNGGSGSTQQALTNGTPVLAIVHDNMDQYSNMNSVINHGAGKMLRYSEISENILKETVMELLKNKQAKQAAKTLQNEMLSWQALENFDRILTNILAAKNSMSN